MIYKNNFLGLVFLLFIILLIANIGGYLISQLF